MITSIAIVVGLFMLGLILLGIEVFIIPGFGVVGVLGIGALGGAAVLAWLQVGPAGGLASLLAAVLGTVGLVQLARRTRFARRMVLNQAIVGQAPDESLMLLVGKEGTAATPLRPAGTMELADRSLDVVADGQYVEAGTKVRISRVEGGRVVVEPVTDFEKGRA